MKKRNFKNSIFYNALVGMLFVFIVPIIFSIPFALINDILEKIPEPFYTINDTYLLLSLPSLLSYIALLGLKDNKKIRSIFKLNNNKILKGLCIGFLLNSICILVAYVSSGLSLSFNKFNISVLIYAFIGVLVPAAAEELMCRGYIQNILLQKYNKPKLAIIINSLIFSLLHFSHEGITLTALISTFAFGILLSLITYYSKNIWEAIFIHTAWNFTQNIIFGLPNSGLESPYSIFKVLESNNNFAYNTQYGIESSIVATLLFIIFIILIQYKNKK